MNEIEKFEQDNFEKLDKFISKIKKENIYFYNRLIKQMDIYIDKQGVFNPTKDFYSFLDLLIKDNYKLFKSEIKAFLDDATIDNYYFWFYLYKDGQPEILDNKTKNEIINRTNTEKTLINVINKNESKSNKKISKTIRNLVILGKSAEFIMKITEKNIKTNSYFQERITDTETTRILTEARNEANKSLNLDKVWVSTIDKKTRDTHRSLDGQKTNEYFVSRSGSIGLGPGKMNSSKENINCRCRYILESNRIQSEAQRRIRIATGAEFGVNVVKEYKTFEDYKKLYKII